MIATSGLNSGSSPNSFVFLMFTNTKDIARQNVICICICICICIFVEPLDPSSSPCRGRFQGRLVVCTKKLKTLVRSYQLVCEIQGEREEEDSWGINTGGKKGEKEAAWSDCVWWAGIVVNTEHRILFLSLALPGSLYAMIQPDMDIFEIFTRPCARKCCNSQWLLKITSMYNCTWFGNCNSTLKEELSSV